jgi:predicted tellurium resistance membrane protein TerC
MRAKPTAITDLPSSPEAERRGRMIRYTIAMGIRMVCIALVIVVPDWWRLAPAIGAIVLPYFAVIIANNASRRPSGTVARPGSVVRVEASPSASAGGKDAA